MRNFIFLIILIAILYSCNTVEDPIYIPLPDSLKFSFNTSDTFLYISNFKAEEKFVISVNNRHGLDPTSTYDYQYLIVNFEEIDLYDSFGAITAVNSNTSYNLKNTSTDQISFSNDAKNLNILWLGNFSTSYYYRHNIESNEIEILGKKYTSVYEFYNYDNLDSNEVYKIQFQHQYGILRYYFNNGEVFELKEVRTGN